MGGKNGGGMRGGGGVDGVGGVGKVRCLREDSGQKTHAWQSHRVQWLSLEKEEPAMRGEGGVVWGRVQSGVAGEG